MALDNPVACLDSGSSPHGIHATLLGQIRGRNRTCRKISHLAAIGQVLAAQTLPKAARLGPPFPESSSKSVRPRDCSALVGGAHRGRLSPPPSAAWAAVRVVGLELRIIRRAERLRQPWESEKTHDLTGGDT